MKYILTPLILCISLAGSSQLHYSTVESDYNKFIKKESISWAAEFDYSYFFPETPLIDGQNIYNYLVSQKKKGAIKSYRSIVDFLRNEKPSPRKYLQVDDAKNQPDGSLDSAKKISFHHIVFIEKHLLKTYLIAASPLFSFKSSSEVFIGRTYGTYSSINPVYNQVSSPNDKIVLLKSDYLLYKFDSLDLQAEINIKKTYGKTLAFSLWYDLSQGYNSVKDLKTNREIAPQKILQYSVLDSVEAFDENTNSVRKIAGQPVWYNFTASVGLDQVLYYNVTKNIFFSKVTNAYLYVGRWVETKMITEKRFQISFK